MQFLDQEVKNLKNKIKGVEKRNDEILNKIKMNIRKQSSEADD